MSAESSTRHDPYAPFRIPDYQRLVVMAFLTAIVQQAQSVAIDERTNTLLLQDTAEEVGTQAEAPRSAPSARSRIRMGAGLEHEPMISIRNITRSYGEIRAVDDVSLEIARGERARGLSSSVPGPRKMQTGKRSSR